MRLRLKAIATTQNKNSAANVTLVFTDLCTVMPEGGFDNVVFDAVIVHFTPHEYEFRDMVHRMRFLMSHLATATVFRTSSPESSGRRTDAFRSRRRGEA